MCQVPSHGKKDVRAGDLGVMGVDMRPDSLGKQPNREAALDEESGE